MTDTTDIAALKINTYSVNSNDAWPQCADDDRTGSYVKWEDLVKLLSDKSQGSEPETGFDSLKNLKFVADCCIENPDSIYVSEFFLLLDEMFGKQGDYSMPVQAVAVSHLIGLLEAERQRADELVLHVNTQANMREKAEKERDASRSDMAVLYERLRHTEESLIASNDLLTAAEKERDDLKAAQIPFTPVGILMKRLPELEAENAELRAKLANPVALPTIQCIDGDEWYWADAVIKSIHTNGFNTVKGE